METEEGRRAAGNRAGEGNIPPFLYFLCPRCTLPDVSSYSSDTKHGFATKPLTAIVSSGITINNHRPPTPHTPTLLPSYPYPPPIHLITAANEHAGPLPPLLDLQPHPPPPPSPLPPGKVHLSHCYPADSSRPSGPQTHMPLHQWTYSPLH